MRKNILLVLMMLFGLVNNSFAETLINANFNIGVDGFDINIDGFVFRTDVYGNEAPADRTIGTREPGRLHTYLGNGQRGGVGVLAGGWINSFQTTVKSDITITLVCQHRLSGKAETNEFSEVMCVVNNVMYFPDSQPSVSRFFGDGNNPSNHMDTGVITAVIHLTVEPGIHSLGLGFYLNQATAKDEWAEVYFDSIVVERTDYVPPFVDDINKDLVFSDFTTTSGGSTNMTTMYYIDEGEAVSFLMRVVDKNHPVYVQSPIIREMPEGANFENNLFSWIPGSDQSGFYRLVFEFGSGDNYLYQIVELAVVDTFYSVPVGQLYEKLITAVDPDGDDWEMLSANLPLGATLIGEKRFGPKLLKWTPTLSQVGDNSFSIEVTDFPRDADGNVQTGIQLTDIRNFTINVVP